LAELESDSAPETLMVWAMMRAKSSTIFCVTVVGHFPLVLATSLGAGARNSIGIMLVSGMIIGTLFTLFVVPSIYMLVAQGRAAAVSREASLAEVAASAVPGAAEAAV
jgi:Cu/Ag efflux pump CusA